MLNAYQTSADPACHRYYLLHISQQAFLLHFGSLPAADGSIDLLTLRWGSSQRIKVSVR